ncbi:MAG TPA: hypothetical protein PKI62_10440 [bacterium]|nr:hypothetical protein [bacterium]HPR87873.1 hypothetical protein [bacterium]
MKVFFALLVPALLGSAVCGAQELPLTRLLPQPLAEKGWRFDLEPQTYGPENLFEYIDGEADLYNEYHFIGMATAAFTKGGDMAFSYTVDISEFATPLDAFGLYSRHRTPDLTFTEIGEEATLSELNLRFHQNRYVVQINAGSFEGEVQDEMLRVAHAIAALLPPAAPPHELLLLPREGQQPHSLQYFTQGMLGQSAFPAGLMAAYVAAGDTMQAFLVLTPEARQSLAAFAHFADNLKQRGTLIAEQPGRIEVETPWQGRILGVHHLHWIVGVIGHRKTETGEALVASIIANLGE